MRINHNIPSLQSTINLRRTDRKLSAAMQRLSSGLRINSAKDDAAGLAIANKLDNQSIGLDRASQNSMDGISLIQTAEGALTEVHNMLQRMRELAIASANDSMDTDDRNKVQMEINQLTDEINATAGRTEFNKIKVLGGEISRTALSHIDPDAQDMGFANQIATPIYISDAVPSGNLAYTIQSAGTPAKYSLAGDLTAPGRDGLVWINGVSVEIKEDDTDDMVKEKMTWAFDMAGMDFINVGGENIIATRVAGSQQHISITSPDASFSAALGVGGIVEEAGLDAVVDNVVLTDKNGNDVVAFNNNHSITVNGNDVTIASSNGQKIVLNVKSSMQDDSGDIAYANGDDYTTSQDMNLEITDYGPLVLHIGPNYNMEMVVQIPALDAETLGIVEYKEGKMSRKLNYQTVEGSLEALGVIDNAISFVSEVRAKLGAYQNRLEMTVKSLDATAENTKSARSRIQDTDMAAETTRYTQYQVMEQAGISILAQANQRPQQVLSLLQ